MTGQRVQLTSATTAQQLSGGPNWRLCWYDTSSHDAGLIDGVDWNSGAYDLFNVDARPIALPIALISAGDYSSSTLHDLSNTGAPTSLFQTRGWGIRLVQGSLRTAARRGRPLRRDQST